MPGGEKQELKHLDWIIIAAVIAISIGGLFAIRSATHLQVGSIDFVRKQTLGVIAGLLILLSLAVRDYGVILKRFAGYLYPLNILLLLIVMKAGHGSHGAVRWIGIGPLQLQPSELAKLIIICTLSVYLTKHQDHIKTWPTVLTSLAHVGIPMVLIAKQPDLGTALVLLAVWLGTVFIAGARWQQVSAILLCGVVLFAGLWHFNGLKDYQKNRLQVFLNPKADPRDSGYHLHQSEIAIGSGGITGDGYLNGSQSNGNFIPEQHTDFIFTVVGEEGGFMTSIILLGLYLLILIRGILIMVECDDRLGQLLSAGILSMLAFHIVVNMGMTMGIMPVVGVPLPFFSYGLSSLLVNMAALGLLLNIGARKHRVMF